MGMKIKDEYGNKVGSVEEGYLHDYKIKDKNGNTIGTADKDFLSSDYTVRTSSGEKTGKVEKNLFGDGYTVKDKNGRKIATTKSTSGVDFDFGTGGVIAIIAVVALFILGIKLIPEMVVSFFDIKEWENWFIIGPFFLFIIANILMIVLKKDIFIADHPIKKELGAAAIVTAIDTVLVLILLFIEAADRKSFLDRIFIPIIEIIASLPSLIVMFLPVGLIFGIIIAIKNK